MIIILQSGFIRKSGCVRQMWFYLSKLVVFGKKVIVFGQKCLYSENRGYIRVKVVVFWQNWLYSGKSGCIGANKVFR